jgi:2-oxoglutarate dehydrogenase E2 component (dihydrolipoamide succinyltransferase)
MPIELKIPEVGESITEVQISEWLKAEGDTVQRDEPVAVIDSEKTTFELPAPDSGTLSKVLNKPGDTVKVGAVIGQIEPSGAAAPATKTTQPAAAKVASQEKPEPHGAPELERKAGARQPDAEASLTSLSAKERPAPDIAGKREAAELSEVGRQEEEPPRKARNVAKRLTKPMFTAARTPETEAKRPAGEALAPQAARPAASQPSTDHEEEIVPMTMFRRTIARRLIEAQQTMAMLTTFNEVDMGAVQTLRHEHQEAFQRRHGIKLGLMSFFVKAVIDALKQFPPLNAEVRATDIVYRNYFDIGVAIATDRGLIVPVLRRAERLNFAEVEKAIADFAQRAKESELKPDDLEGGTFTITNGGVFGSLLSSPIINPPQSGILGLHAIQDRPVAREGNVVIRPMMYMALTYDHRIVDGREAVLFLRRIKDVVENPARMLIEV